LDADSMGQHEPFRLRLRRDVGLLGSFSFGYADVGAGIYLTLGLVAQFSGPATPLSFAVASLAYLFTALSYAELASSFPEAGGGLIYSEKAFGKLAAFITAWCLLLDYVVTTSIFALAAVGYMGYFLPALHGDPYFSLAALLLVSGLVVVNCLGVRESAGFSAALVLLDVSGITLVILAGYLAGFRPFWEQINWGTTPDLNGFLYGSSIAMASFLGIEVISQTAEETKVAGRTIPRAVFLVSAAVVVISIAFSSLAVGVVPWNILGQSYKDPAAIVAEYLPYGRIFGAWLGLMGMTVCIVAANAGIVGVSRMAFSMSREGLLPRWLGSLHRKYRVPYRAIILFASIQLLLAYTGHMGLSADLYNFGALLSYMLVNLALIALRRKDPSRFRPFKLPGTIKLGHGQRFEMPLIALLGFVSCGFVWTLVVLTHETGRLIGFLWLGLGLLLYYLYRRSRSPKLE